MKKSKNQRVTPENAGLPTAPKLRAAIVAHLTKMGITRPDLILRLEDKVHTALAEHAAEILDKALEDKAVLAELSALLSGTARNAKNEDVKSPALASAQSATSKVAVKSALPVTIDNQSLLPGVQPAL